MTPEIKKMKSDITNLKLYCAELFQIATAQRDQLQEQAQQITELKQIISELYYQVHFSESENINYSEKWILEHCQHPKAESTKSNFNN